MQVLPLQGRLLVMRVIRSAPISTEESGAIEEARQRRFHKAMALKEELGLTKQERYELAQLLPGVDKDDGGSWKDLTPKQLHDLITMMEGFVYITHILQERLDTEEEA